MKKQYHKNKYKYIKALLFISFLAGNVFILSAQNCVVNAGVLNVSICQNDALLLEGNTPSPIIGPVKWTQISGPSVIITSPNSPTSTVTGYTGGNTYVFRYSATCGDGVVAFQDKTVVVQPITIADADADIASCPNSSGSLIITGNTPQNPGETGEWLIVGANNAGVIVNFPNSPTSTITLPQASCGTTTLSWTITGPEYSPGQFCQSGSSITITNYGGVTPVDAGSNQSLSNCYTTTQNTNLSGSFGGCGLNGQQGTWTFVSGPNTPTISSPTTNNTNVSNLIQGVYVFRWTVSGPCVSGSDTVTVTVPAATQDVTVLSGGDVNIYFCDPTINQATLVAQTPLYAGETVQWTQVGGTTLPPGSIQSPNSPSTLVTGINDAGDPYRFRYTLTNVNTGCTFSKDYIVEYRQASRTIVANNGDNIYGACGQTDFSIPIVTTGTGISRYRILSGPATSPLAPFPTTGQNIGGTLNISLTEPGTYVLQFLRSETGELPVDCDYGYDSMTIVVSGLPTPSNAGSDVNLACGLTEAPLSGVGTAPSGSHYWAQLSGPNTAVIVDRLAQNTTAQGLISGTYVFQYITKGGGTGCALSIDTVNVNVSSSTLSAVDAGPDDTVCVGSQAQLAATPAEPGEIGTWSQVSGPVTVVFSDLNDPNAIATGFDAANTAYGLRWTIAYEFPGPSGCSVPISDDVTITTNADASPSIANAGPDACYPGGTTVINLSGNTPGVLEQGIWSAVPSAGVVFTDANDPNTTVTIPGNDTYVFRWSVNKIIGSCDPTTDSTEITVADDIITVDAGPNQDICGNQIVMAAALTSGAIGTWTQVSGLGGYTVNDINNPNATFAFTLSGPYVFRWTVTAGSCSTGFDDVLIRVGIPPATALAGPDQQICSANINPTVTLAGNAYDAFFETGEWSLLTGAPNQPTITNALEPNTTITNLTTGTYNFRWTIASKGNFLCPASFDDVVIEVAPAANAGNDQTYCDVDNVQLVGNVNSRGTWTLTGGNPAGVVITQSPANSYVANATVVPGNTYQFTYTLDTYNFIGGGTCTGNSDNVSVTVFEGSSIPPAAGPDQTLCIADVAGTVTMAGNTAPGDVDSAVWRFLYQPAGSVAVITTPASPTTTVTNMTVPGLYVLEWVFINASCRDLSDIVRVTMYQAPSTADAGPDDAVACQQTYQTNAVAPTAGIGTWTFAPGGDPSAGAAVIDNPNNPQTTLSNVTALGTYTLLWTVTNGPFTNPSLCQPSTDTVSITFNDTPPSQAAAGPDQQLCAATQTNLAAVPLAEGLGTWTQTSGPNTANIASPNAPNTTVFGLITGTYEFTWTATTLNNDGCSSFDTMLVEIVQQPVAADAGPNQVIPQFTPVVMAATAPTVGVGTWSQLSGPTAASFVNINSATTQVSGTAAGTYVFQWQISNGICSTASDVVSVQILSLADLELTNTVAPTTANYGDVVAFTVSIFNNPALGGSVDATGVVVKDLIPAGYTLIPGSVSNGGIYNIGDQSITWSGLAVLNGATLNLTFNATVNPTGSYVNTAQIMAMNQVDDDSTPNNDDGDQSEDDEDNAVITASPTPADLSLTKTVVANNITPLVGSQITFEIVVTNDGPEDATGVQVSDLIPSGYDYVSFSSSKGVYNEITGVWTIGGIANGDLESLLIDVIVLPAGDYLNIAQIISSDQPDSDSTPGNNVATEDDYASVTTTPVALSADLSLTKAVNNPTPLIGSQVSFEIVVTNSGPQNTTGVQVTDLLPTGYSYNTFSATAGTYNSSTGVWNVGSLINGDSETLIITATVNATGVYVNTAQVTASSLPDPDSTVNNGDTTEDDYASVTTTPIALAADLSLTKTVNNATPLVGSQVTFIVTIANAGPDTTSGVTVTDLLPTGYTFVSSTATQGGYVAGTGVWTVGTMVNGASEILQVTATVNPTGIYVNTTQVTSSSLLDPDSTVNNSVTTEDDYASVTTTPTALAADLSLTKTVNNATPLVGSQVIFTVTVSNAGPNNTTGVTVIDLLPSGYTFVSATTTQGGYNSGTGVWSIGAVANGVSEILQVTATVNATGVYVNTAEVTTSSLPDTDSTVNNGITTEDDYASATVVPTALAADLSLTKTLVGGNTTPLIGSQITFNVTVANAGPQDAAGVAITDALPAGYTFVSSNATQGNYDPGTGIWTVGNVGNGDAETLLVTVTVNTVGSYQNIAEVSASSLPDQDSTPGNAVTTEDDYATITTTPTALAADLSLTKTVSTATPLVGSQVTFTITVANAGPNSTSGVTVTDLLPTGYTFVSSTATQGGYVAGTGVWTIGSLANGASEILQVTATVNPTGVYLNTAEVTASSLPDTDSTVSNGAVIEDDYATLITIPTALAADLSLTKTIVGGNTTPLVGSQISFEIVVSNAGSNNVTGVQVTDLLPSGYAYTIFSATSGTYNSSTGIWNVGSLANGDAETLIVTATVNAAGNYQNVAEVTASSLPDTDSTVNNGITTEDDYTSVTPVPVPVSADLSITKTVNKPTPLVGTGVVFEIVITNNGPQDATGIQVTDLLPSGYTYIIATTTAGVYNNDTGIWAVGTVTNGNSETLLINASVLPTGNYLNTAEITASSLPDPDSTPGNANVTEDDYASVSTAPVPVSADLSLTKTVNNPTPLIGSTVTFELIITNSGPQGATGVEITDQLPSGYAFVIASSTSGIYNSATGVWIIGALPSGTSETLLINATVVAGGSYENIAEVTASNQPDPDSTPNNGVITEDDYASVNTLPIAEEADLSISKTIVGGNTTPLVGTQMIFNVTVSNNGPQPGTGVLVTDLLPSGYTFVSYTATDGIYNEATGIWDINSAIASGASVTLQITVIVNSSGNYLNVAEITSSNVADPDSIPGNNVTTEDDYASIAIVPVAVSADLSITKTVNKPAPLIGTTVTFEVIVTNNGPQSATNVQITDQLPSGYAYVLASTTAGIYNSATGVWAVGTLASGASESMLINATVLPTGNYLNIAEVTTSNVADPDSTPGNGVTTEDDYASAITVPVASAADLSLSKTIVGGNTTPLVGIQMIFNVTVSNTGPQPATGVLVTDILPSGYTFVSYTATEGAYNAGTGVWDISSAIATGTSETLQVTVLVNGTGTYLNTAEITGSYIADPDSTPNNGVITEDDYASAITVPIPVLADLSLTKTVNNATPAVGSGVTFEVVITNNGPQTATGVQVTDQLPSGYAYILASTTAGIYNSSTGVWVVGNLASGVSETMLINGTVLASGNYLNVAEVSASNLPDPDSTPNNGVVTEDDYASAITVPVIPTADLSITKTIVGGNATPLVGSQIIFEVTISNAGPQPVTNVQVSDLLPTGYTFVSYNATEGVYNAVTGLWNIGGVIASGASNALQINAIVNATGNYLNVAEITASGLPDPDSTPANGVTTEDDYARIITVPIPVSADLYVTKTVNNATPLVGAPVTFEVIVTNNGPQLTNGVTVTDLLPSGYTFVLASSTAGTYNSVTGIWSVGSLANGASETLLINATVNATGNYINIAQVSASSLPDPDSTPGNSIATEDDQASATVAPITLTADLFLTKTVNNATPLVGASVTFEVIVTNNGPQATTGVQVTDQLPTGYTYTLASATAGTYNSVTGVWSIGNLASGASETLLINATVNATGSYVNIAQVSASDLPDPDSTPGNSIATEDDQASASVAPIALAADLSLTKTVIGGNLTPLAGSQVSFEIIVNNAGPQNVSGVQVTDLLPTGYAYVVHSATAGSYNSVTGLWNIGTLFNGDSETLIVTAIVNVTGNYTNIAQVNASSLPDPDSTPGNNLATEDDQASVTLAPVALTADLSLTKTVNNVTPLVGTPVTFEVIVTNNGPQASNGVLVTDLLPTGYTYILASTTVGTYNSASGLWIIGSLASGTSETLLINATVNAIGDYENIAQVSASSLPDPDSTPGNGIATEDDQASASVVPVPAKADLSITKTVNNATPLVGSSLTFEVVVTNNGPQDAAGVQVTDLLPSGYAYVLASTTSGVYNSTDGLWTIGSLADGMSETLLINAIVLPSGNYLNVAEVTASSLPDPDSTPGNGITTEDDYSTAVTIPVATSADLSLTKTVNNTAPLIGSTVTFEVIITNNGPQATTGVQVTDILPSGYAYVLASSTAGVYNNGTGIWLVGTLANGASETLLINAVVLATGNYENIAQVTASSVPDPDSTPGNNVTTEDDQASATVVPVIQSADLSLTKTINDTEPVEGEEVTFEVTVTNAGPQAATGVQVVDLLPSGYAYVISSTTSGTYNPSTGLWNIGTIGNGDTETLLVTATVLATGNYLNIAQVTASVLPDPDSTPNNDDGDQSEDDEDSVTIQVQSTDIAITKDVDIADPVMNTNVTFTITASNLGTTTGTNIEVMDILPTGYELISATVTSGTYDTGSGLWTIPVINGGSQETLTVTVKVIDKDDYLNTAALIGLDQIDTNEANNEDSAGVQPRCLKIYNEFSPNGDGDNDTFNIDCIAQYPNNVLEIFNRWGDKVYSRKAYDNSWDGTSDGPEKTLPVGTYFYILDLGDGAGKTSGWLYIKR